MRNDRRRCRTSAYVQMRAAVRREHRAQAWYLRTMGALVLEDRWPLVVVRWPAVTTKADVEAFLGQSEVQLARREPHVVVHDARLGVNMPASERKRFAD